MPKTLFNWKLHATREKTMHAQKSRTAEVTICIIPERTARSLPTVTVRLETQVIEENVHGVIVHGIECSGHGGPPRHSYRAHS